MTSTLLIALASMLVSARPELNAARTDTPSESTPLSTCEKQFRARPKSYTSSRCFMLLGSKVRNNRLRESIGKLQQAYPDSMYLELARVFIDRRSRTYPELRDALLNLYSQTHDTPSPQDEVVLLSHLIHQARSHLKHGDLETWVAKLEPIAHDADDPITRAYASALVVQHRIDQQEELSDLLKQLELTPKQEARLPYFVHRVVLRIRAEAHRLNLNLADAASDFEALGHIASSANDAMTATIASHGRALVLLDKLSLMSRTPDLQQCIESFKTTIEQAQRSGAKETQAQALSSLALLLYGQGERETIIDDYLQACFKISGETNDSRFAARCHIAKSQVLAKASPKEALRHARMAQEVLRDSPAVTDRIRAWRQIARSLWHLEEHEAALSAAISILGKIEELRQNQSKVGSRMLTLNNWSEDYYWLLSRLIKQEAPSREDLALAFELSERIRARVLLDTLSPASTSDAPKRAQKRAHLETTANPDTPPLPEAALTFETKAFAGSPPRKLPTFLQGTEFASPDLIQSKLSPTQAMIVFQTALEKDYEGERIGGTTAFILTRHRFEAVALPADRRELERLASFQRRAFEPEDETLKVINQRLREKLVKPILQRLASNSAHLILVLDGPLHRISFPALFPDHELSRAPSASYWTRSVQRTHFDGSSVPLVVVDPTPATVPTHDAGDAQRSRPPLGRFRRLEHSLQEANHIRKNIHAKSETLAQNQATLSNFLAHTKPRRGLVHIAAHSIVDEHHPSESYIALAPESQTSLASRLSPKAIADLDFTDTLVVLGGCATGSGTLLFGEGVLSLAYAFLRSNANAVVATLWPIQDKASALFFEFFYECLSTEQSAGYCLDSARRQGRAAGLSKQTTEAFFLLGDEGLSWSAQTQPSKERRWWLHWTAGLLSLCTLGVCTFYRQRRRRKKCLGTADPSVQRNQ